jgi:hypothetical protein
MDELKGVLDKVLVKGYWGEVTLSIQDGKIVLIKKVETVKVK